MLPVFASLDMKLAQVEAARSEHIVFIWSQLDGGKVWHKFPPKPYDAKAK